MRKAQNQVTRRQKAKTLSVPAPSGGWNARDSLAEMDPKDAVKLDNFFCTPFDVMVRKGYTNFVTGFSNPVNTLASYSPPSGTIKLIAAAGANIYDASTAGAVGAPLQTGFASDKWQYVNFGTAGGNFLVMVNGIDAPLIYNDTSFGSVFVAAFNTTVTSITSVGTLASVTMAAPHNLKTGQYVIVSGFTPTGYNGTYQITVTGTSTFTYILAGAQGVTTVTGIVTPSVNFAITGVTPSLFINVTVFKSRLWFVENNSTRVWYMPTLSIGGTAQSIEFNSLFNRGGYVVAMGDWSLDAGYGMDDYAVFITSEGQIAVYRGTDPSSSATWALIGVYDIGSPIGRRCMMKYAGDLTIISQDGLVPLSKALMSSRINTQEALTDKIQHIISDYTDIYAVNFGWKTMVFPKQNMLILNVPYLPTKSYQLVMNTISGAWSRFVGWDAHCWELHGDLLFFGTDNAICKAWDSDADDNKNIDFDGQQSFNYFGGNSQLKQVKMVRPIISTNGNPTLLFGVNVDFSLIAPQGNPTFTPTNPAPAIWDGSSWDSSIWAGETMIKRDWQTAFGLGYCVSGHMKGSSKNISIRWIATDYLLEAGGVV